MNKIMALDIGKKRIGVALTDFLQIIASPSQVIPRQPEDLAIEQIKNIARENHVKTIVIGVPYNMDGTIGSQANDCIEFSSLLKNDFNVVYEDERLSSFEAEQNLKRAGKPYTKDKGLVDMESACIILEQYLNRKDKHDN